MDEGEHSAIFKKMYLPLLKKENHWLSQTPAKPLGWDASRCNRICSYVYLQQKKSVRKFFNAHFLITGYADTKGKYQGSTAKGNGDWQARSGRIHGDLNGSP